MLLRAEFVSLAMRLQDLADGKIDATEAGARNSKKDLQMVQAIHDHAASLGANCSMGMEESLKERDISQGERDKMGKGSFAGKGTSFPIAKPEDVSAAAHSLGRAGSDNYDSATIKSNIIRIAKEKGWASHLPKDWQESEVPRETPGALVLVESAATLDTIVLKEAKADYEIKLIAPGKGSSAFYPAEVLKRDGPRVFKAGTHVYLNHPTAAEEASRPEGDVKNLAGVLATGAEYHESHAKGPGLYARMKVFADHGQLVEEKAPHVGMSIRASGIAESGKTKEGVPVLKELTGAESVDVVTRAGAGGLILTEAAKPQIQTQEAAMDAAEVTKLQEAIDRQEAVNKRLLERALKSDAREAATRILAGVSLLEVSKVRIIESVLEKPLPIKEGELDMPVFTEAVNAAAKIEGAYVSALTGAGRVMGMGLGSPVETDPVKLAEATKRQKDDRDLFLQEAEDIFGEILGSKEAGKAAASKGVN